MAYVFLRVYSEGSSGRVYQCGIPERPLDCEPLYMNLPSLLSRLMDSKQST
ncbi:hypothetical protein YC2023_020124 [Brassica napus]